MTLGRVLFRAKERNPVALNPSLQLSDAVPKRGRLGNLIIKNITFIIV
jgi:hypothetical protein